MSIRALNWAREVCVRIDVPSGERLVLWAIAMHHNDKTGECFPAYDTLAKHTGFSRRKVMFSVADLEANGLLICQKRRVNGHQGSNHFVLFGMPNAARWQRTRVNPPTPCKSEPQFTQTRVNPSSPDRDYSNTGDQAKVTVVPFRVVRHA